jgi:hypothetical protein
MQEGIKVRLKVDLTKYKVGLVAGTEGTTIGTYGMWSRSSDRFVGVHFPDKGTLDVLWGSLEIIDEEYLKNVKEQNERYFEELKSATNVVEFVGPRGGFRYLSFTYTDSGGHQIHTTNGFSKDADRLINFFERNGIEVTLETID